MNRIVAWDLDGTIIDTHNLMKKTYNSILDPEFELDLSVSPWANIKNAGLKPYMHIGRFWNEYRQNAPHLARVYPNIVDILQEIRKKEIYQAIISSLPDEIVKSLLSHTRLTEIFDVVVGGSNLKFRKTNPRSVEYCLKRLNGTKKLFIMIGDSYKDQKLAENAGVHFIAAEWNHRCKLKSQFKCKSPNGILRILERILDPSVSFG